MLVKLFGFGTGSRPDTKGSPTAKSGNLGPHQVHLPPPGVPGGDLAPKRAALNEAHSGESKATAARRLGDFQVQVRKEAPTSTLSQTDWISVLGGRDVVKRELGASVLNAVDRYHAALKAADARFTLADVHTACAWLRNEIGVHVDKLGNAAPDTLNMLRMLVDREAGYLRIVDPLGSSRSTCGAMAPKELLGLARAGADKFFLRAAVERGLSRADAQGYLDLTALPGMRLPGHVLEDHMRTGQGPAELRALLDAGYVLTPRTFNPAYTQAHRGPAPERPLGSGATATVTQIEYIVDGQTARMAFKADVTSGKTIRSNASIDIGVPEVTPRMAGRNMGTFNVARSMGLGIVPTTALATQADGRVGCVMGVVKGRPGAGIGAMTITLPAGLQDVLRQKSESERTSIVASYAEAAGFTDELTMRSARLEDKDNLFQLVMDHRREESDRDAELDEFDRQPTKIVGQAITTRLPLNDPILRKQLTQAQWLDLLVGQVDRNPQNLILSERPDGTMQQLWLIDNDACLGANRPTCRELVKDVTGSFASKLPDVIDRQTHDHLMKMTPAMLRADLSGLVTSQEIDACETRLKEIQAHLATFTGGDRRVVEADAEWGTQAVADALGVDTDATRIADEATKALRKGVKTFTDFFTNDVDKRRTAARQTSYLAREAASEALDLGIRKAITDFLQTAEGREAVASNAHFKDALRVVLAELPPIYDPALLARIAGLEPQPGAPGIETKAQAGG